MRYYLGVDWADQTHAVWVVDESGRKITAREVAHTAEGLGEWGRELNEWRAQGIALWASIERPDGRVVDFLLDHRWRGGLSRESQGARPRSGPLSAERRQE